jgi:hypothetical protein
MQMCRPEDSVKPRTQGRTVLALAGLESRRFALLLSNSEFVSD